MNYIKNEGYCSGQYQYRQVCHVSLFLPFFLPDVDECKNSPCKNNGSCTNLMGGYRCDCSGGFTGKDCDQGQAAFCFRVILCSGMR